VALDLSTAHGACLESTQEEEAGEVREIRRSSLHQPPPSPETPLLLRDMVELRYYLSLSPAAATATVGPTGGQRRDGGTRMVGDGARVCGPAATSPRPGGRRQILHRHS
jgi:hypothetical protein